MFTNIKFYFYSHCFPSTFQLSQYFGLMGTSNSAYARYIYLISRFESNHDQHCRWHRGQDIEAISIFFVHVQWSNRYFTFRECIGAGVPANLGCTSSLQPQSWTKNVKQKTSYWYRSFQAHCCSIHIFRRRKRKRWIEICYITYWANLCSCFVSSNPRPRGWWSDERLVLISAEAESFPV